MTVANTAAEGVRLGWQAIPSRHRRLVVESDMHGGEVCRRIRRLARHEGHRHHRPRRVVSQANDIAMRGGGTDKAVSRDEILERFAEPVGDAASANHCCR